jgi:hypothetical protein
MFPSYFEVLPELPLTTSSKVDRNLLPPPRSPLLPSERVIAPADTALEEKIAKVWKEVFRLEDISVEDDFFLDLHGHSHVVAPLWVAAHHRAATTATPRRPNGAGGGEGRAGQARVA